MPKFKKKPVIIEAVRLKYEIIVSTLEGDMTGNIGDWLITGVEGEQYCCKNNIFMKTYEAADEDAEDYLEKFGTVVIEPKDFEDLVANPKPVKNTLGKREHPRFEGSKFAMDAMEMLDKDKVLRDYRKALYQIKIKELEEELFSANLEKE